MVSLKPFRIRTFAPMWLSVLIPPLIQAPMASFPARAAARETASGVVYHDRNLDGRFDDGDEAVKDVLVSNGVDVVKTDGRGRYSLPVTDDTVLFVVKPRGYQTRLTGCNLPVFHYSHKTKGSPPSRHPGVAPTGPLPESVDFALYPREEPDTFRAVVWADPQPRDLKEIEYITHDVVEELIGVEAAFGVTLGDIVFDNLRLYDDLNAAVAQIGIPWHNVIGNHDSNADSDTDKDSDETFERIFGPHYYAFQYGPVHFIAMDTVIWGFDKKSNKRRFRGGIEPDQLTFIGNYLKAVPKDQLVVLLMHIPLSSGHWQAGDREKLFALLADRPRTLSLSGHTHTQENVFLAREDGWKRDKPHHHLINATVSGSWWSGAPDEQGIPHTIMRDGAPNGYSIITFDKADYRIEFKAARRPAEFQMTIYAPEEIPAAAAGNAEVIVNVFAGSRKSTVEMRIGNDHRWTPMTRFSGMDPYYQKLKQEEESETRPAGRKLPKATGTDHLWKATLPRDLGPGRHTIHVRATDLFGTTHKSARVTVVHPLAAESSRKP